MIDFSTPLAGMQQASASLNRTASRIAGIGGSPQDDAVDLSAETVAMLEAKNSFAANVQSAKTEDQLSKALLNILG